MQIVSSATEQKPPLAECQDCGGRVSRLAVSCPHCGRPFGRGEHNAVRIVDIDMRFGSMVEFMVKWVLASIPAALVLLVLGVIATMMFSAMTGRV